MDINASWDLAIIITSVISLFSGAILAGLALRKLGDIIDAFKSGALVFQMPIRTNKADFSDWEFEQVFDKRSGKSELTITVATNRGAVILPTLLVSDWTDFLTTLPGAKKSQNGKTGQNGHNQSSKKAKKSKSKNGVFVGKAKVVAQQVLTISPQVDLYTNQKIRLADGSIAQIKSIQDNGQDINQAAPGQHVGLGLDIVAVAGAVHKA